MDQFEPLLSVEEFARMLGGISRWTVYAWCSQGKLHRVKVGRRTMLRQSELVRVIRDEQPKESPKIIGNVQEVRGNRGAERE